MRLSHPILGSIALGLCSALFSAAAHADQCAYISQQQAAKALDHIKPGSTVINFCEPCGDKNFFTHTEQKVTELKAAPAGYQDFWEISVNGKGIDLAYTFVKMPKDGSFLNLSKLADCPSQSVSTGFAADQNGSVPAQEPDTAARQIKLLQAPNADK